MKIHTDVMSFDDLEAALATVEKHTGEVAELAAHRAGSRSRSTGYVVHLTGDGSVSRHKQNVGRSSRPRDWALSYDGWGWFLAHLFEIDPRMIAGTYKGRDDFHNQTKGDYQVTVNA